MKPAYLRVWLLITTILISATGWSQERTITGTVLSVDDNSPLPGVNILVKGKTTGTQTDAAGIYRIAAVTGDILVFSFTGFDNQEVAVSTSSAINIALARKAGDLGEVVVVGYGTQSRRNITSAIAKLDNKVLENAPRANVGTALQGTITGLQVVNSTGSPGTSPQLLLRGGASINNPGSPLVVVDGIIRSFNDVVSEDIASIEVLKDAASTAIYGARANNGVILITTKQGKAGKAELSYKFTGGYNKRRDGYRYMNAKDYIYYNRLGNLNSGRTLAQVNGSRGYGLLTDPANLAMFDIRAFDASNASFLSQGWDTVGDPYNPGSYIIFKDHSGEIEDIVFRNTYTQEHYVNVVGGNDKGKYFASFDYYNEDGVIVGSGYKRYSGDINGSYKIKPNLEVSTGVVLSNSTQTGTITSEINTLYRSLAIWPTMNPWLDSAKTMPNPGNSSSDGNPLYWIDKLNRSNEVNRITANGAVKWDILPDLYIKATGNVYLNETLNRSFQQATQNYANLYTDPPSYSNTSRNAISYFYRDFQQQFNAIANYSKTFGDKHDLNAMIGAEYYDINSFEMQVFGQNAPTDDISTANASTTFNAGSNYSAESEFKIISNFGRINYDYDHRYLFSLVYRQDGVSSLSEENRWGFFPGMSAGWNVHNEQFFRNSGISNYISTLKPRISYGENGNIAGLGRYEVQGVYGSTGLYNNNAGFLNTGIINSDLRWEKSKTTDVGIDIGLLDNRINIIFDYYNRKTSDLLTNLDLPSYTGFSTVRTNLGTFQNQGYEFSINANVLNQADGLKIDVGANASFVQNKILELPYNGNENNRQGGLQVYDPASGKVVWVGGLQQGQPLGAIYAFQQVSIFKDDAEVEKIAGNRIDVVGNISGPNSTYGTGKITPGDVNWLDIDKNDTIDSRDQVYMGNLNPKWTGGFTLNVSYKRFSLFSRFDFAVGHTVYNDVVARTLGNFQGTFNYIDLQKDAWTPENPNTDIPKVYYADQVSAPLGKKNYTRVNNANAILNGNNSRFYEKGDYFACREITLAYDFSSALLQKTRVLSKARLYLNTNNLFYITNFSGASPEPPVLDGSLTGIFRGTYPTPVSFVLGAQVSF